MSYFFPHQTRDKKKEETVELFTKYLAVSCDILEDVSRQIIIDTPLLENLIDLPIEEDQVEWTLEQWQSVCVENGYEQVPEEWLNKIEHKGTRETFAEWTKDAARLYQKDGFVISYDKDLSNWWHWHWWNRTVSSWNNRLTLIKDASFNLKFLEWHDDYIYSHEAFLILMGISSDKLDREEFKTWFYETAPQRFIDYPQIEEYGLKQNYTEFDEWKRLKRRFGNDTNDLYFEIDTQDFNKWALNNGVIEQNTAHFRDGRFAPFQESFTEMLHEELLAEKLIKQGKYHHTWIWASTGIAYNYLVRLLALNKTPQSYYENRELENTSWEDMAHYIECGVKNPNNHNTIPTNAVIIEKIVQKLMEDHDNKSSEGFKLPNFY